MFGLVLLFCGSTAVGQSPAGFDQLELAIEIARRPGLTQVSPELLIHFHGDPRTTAKNFRQAGLSGVLLTVNCRGLSSAYRRPFENESLFPYLVQHVRQELIQDGILDDKTNWKRIDVSCFSAGYGAVREILRDNAAVQQIESVAAADSIYASIKLRGGQRRVDVEQMQPFLDFAFLAIQGHKVFHISHSQLAVEAYASTKETAEYLLSEIGLARRSTRENELGHRSFSPISIANRGSFTVIGFPGDDGEGHLEHLRNISVLWKQIRSGDAEAW